VAITQITASNIAQPLNIQELTLEAKMDLAVLFLQQIDRKLAIIAETLAGGSLSDDIEEL
jgi:methyltransferase-like protein